MGNIGRYGNQIDATNTDNTFPKFDETAITMYFNVFPYVNRPYMTPSATTIRFFSRRIISADSFAISVPVSTDIPMSDSARAGESLIPSPKKPTIWLFLLRPVQDLRSAQSKLAIAKNGMSFGVLKNNPLDL
jgi:hypothetical protein